MPTSIIIGIASAAGSSVLTYITTRSKIRLDLRVEFDKQIREKRLDFYQQIWPKTQPLGRYNGDKLLTYDSLREVSAEMGDWYFRGGGLFLSNRSRRPYFALKDLMLQVLEDQSLHAQPNAQLSREIRNPIVDAASELRTSLADDLQTRTAQWLSW